ncbi:hemerythrin domain-containing protein [uncultured Pseudokineococcus sp.]|uniref:hemerythrin domain-containing protein n=1 Tax=uncultured Pseudokineococcus sp. TaxID=1642928 RepID=UPI0026380B5B|nr:hemerythrin domain-containing protein [uncultured Pseudokineococcus sp.]
MRATEVLSAHHDELRSMLTRLAELPGDRVDERQEVLDRLVDELSMHEQLEDEIFYPAVTAASPMVAIAHAEHRYLEDQVAVVLRTGPGRAGFDEEVRVLHEAVEHHAGHEETEMFTEVDAKLDADVLEQMGERISARLAQLRASRITRLRLRVKRGVLRRTPGGARRAG